MKDDLISRQAAIETLSEYGNGRTVYIGAEEAIRRIEQLLPAQPELIRCKDCKHLQKWRSEESAKKFGQIYECGKNVLVCPKPEDFCSYAER